MKEMTTAPTGSYFAFSDKNEVLIQENAQHKTREPWLMLLARRNRKQTETLCWGLTNNGSAFARIGTQEGDIINGFVHEDPYKTRLLGPYAYIRDEDGSYFSNTWYPMLHAEQKLETVFGFGYVVYKTAYRDIAVETTCFIPDEADAMVQIIRIKNNASVHKTLKMYNVNPVNIGDANEIQFSGYNTLTLGGAIFDEELRAIAWRSSYGIPFGDDNDKIRDVFGKVGIHTTSLSNSSFSTKYEDFVGHYTNSMANPEAVVSGKTLRSADAEELTSALSAIQNELSLAPGEEKTVVVVFVAASTEDYYCNGKKELKTFLADILVPATALARLEGVKKSWTDDLNRLQVSSQQYPQITANFKWLQYQCAMVALLNRMKSRFHSGFEYGYGFRDILQDLLALLPYAPAQAKEMISFTAQQMFSDGFVYHNFFVSAAGEKGFVTCDDPLWLIFAVCEYIKETGDFAYLNEVLPYADAKEGFPEQTGTVLAHCELALEKVWRHSDNGLPFMLMADWNDNLSGLFSHTSTMAAQQLYKAFNDLAQLLALIGGHAELIADYRARAAVVKESIETHCIDAKGYYIRAKAPRDTDPDAFLAKFKPGMSGFDVDELREILVEARRDGNLIDLGNSESDGNIFFETIAWAGFSGVADKERFDACVSACDGTLDNRDGVRLCKADKNMVEGKLPIDYQVWKRNAVGRKENGSNFRHLESWYIASLAGFGYGKKAWDLYFKTIPAECSKENPERYSAEGFVYPEYVASPDSSSCGRAGHTWLTGTAPTRLGVLTEWIFGVRRDYAGLVVDPCVDPSWSEFSLVRNFRNTEFTITFSNPEGVEKGVASLSVDGVSIVGNVIPQSLCDGKKHAVKVVMGTMAA